MMLLLLFGHTGATRKYEVNVVNRSLTSQPLLEYNITSFAKNTLNAAWLPLPGEGNQGGGLFFRVMAAPGTPGFDAIGFVKASTIDGLHYPRVNLSHLLRDGPNGSIASGADPRATSRPATGEYFVTCKCRGCEPAARAATSPP